MTTTTDLKPGDVVWQPVHGYGIVYVDGTGETLVMHCSAKGRISIADLDGWERVETCTADAVRILEDYQQIVSKSAGVVVRDAVVMMTTAAYEAYRGREIVQPGHVQVRVDDLDLSTLPDRMKAAVRVVDAHEAVEQPDEPTEFGARVTVTRESGTREKWCRLGRDKDAPWLDENCECGGDSWQTLCRLGTVSLGWGGAS